MLFYGDVRSILQTAPLIDRDATRALMTRLYPEHHFTIADDTPLAFGNPPEGSVFAGCFPGLTVVCTPDAGIDYPSQLDRRFLAELDRAAGRTLYLHAMHSVVGWFAYAIWASDGSLRRSLSLSPDHGIQENVGSPLPFEAPYWAGERPVEVAQDEEEDDYPLEFHPLELAEDALRYLFGFNYEGYYQPDDPDLESIMLAHFVLGQP